MGWDLYWNYNLIIVNIIDSPTSVFIVELYTYIYTYAIINIGKTGFLHEKWWFIHGSFVNLWVSPT